MKVLEEGAEENSLETFLPATTTRLTFSLSVCVCVCVLWENVVAETPAAAGTPTRKSSFELICRCFHVYICMKTDFVNS